MVGTQRPPSNGRNLTVESDLKSDMLLFLLLIMAKMNLDTHPSSLRLKDSSDYLFKTSRKNLLINTCPITCFNICPTSSKKSPSAKMQVIYNRGNSEPGCPPCISPKIQQIECRDYLNVPKFIQR
jgi:hypothetical protein